jgi:hypothetical protein
MHSAARRFSGSDRRRKSGPRHACGKLIQRSPQEREADIRSVVLQQSHRFGSADVERATLIGRLVTRDPETKAPPAVQVDGHTPRQLYDLAEKLIRDHGRYQAALASRRPLAVTGGGVQRPDPDPVAEQKAIDRWAFICCCLRVHGERVEKAMLYAVLDAPPDRDQRTVSPAIILSLPLGFRALAEAYS